MEKTPDSLCLVNKCLLYPKPFRTVKGALKVSGHCPTESPVALWVPFVLMGLKTDWLLPGGMLPQRPGQLGAGGPWPQSHRRLYLADISRRILSGVPRLGKD